MIDMASPESQQDTVERISLSAEPRMTERAFRFETTTGVAIDIKIGPANARRPDPNDMEYTVEIDACHFISDDWFEGDSAAAWIDKLLQFGAKEVI